MPLKIVRNDITKMNTEAIVNTANAHVTVGPGCDSAIYKAAGYDELLAYRKEKFGYIPEGGFHYSGVQFAGKIYYSCSKSTLPGWRPERRGKASLMLQKEPFAC